MTKIAFTHQWEIEIQSSNPTVELAGVELQQTLQRMTGIYFAIVDHARKPGKAFHLTHDAKEKDGFNWSVQPERISIHGHSVRGLLYGVYDFLEALGCRWVAPGERWENLPVGDTFDLPESEKTETPAFDGRCLVIGHQAFMDDIGAWIVWAARNRFNTIFLHTTDDRFGLGSVPEWHWAKFRERALPMIRERSLVIEYGGHGMSFLLPRELFKRIPDAFRMENGRRTAQHNFCPSSEEAATVIRENARHYFEERAGYDVYHVWADDLPGGGWCHCDKCAHYTPSDQLMLVTNRLADLLTELDPRAQIAFLAYHDTEEPSTQVKPRPNVCLLWAPRARNYAYAISDSRCPVNFPNYRDNLRAQIASFQGAAAKRARVFEYYTDAILFKSILPPLVHVMQQDLHYYHELDIHTVQTLMTGTRPWLTAQPNVWLFGRLAWNPNQDVDELVSHFCRAAFPGAEREMARYYAALEKAFAIVLNRAPEQRGLTNVAVSPMKFVQDPMVDMEDPFHASLETLRQKSASNVNVLALLERAEQRLGTSIQQSPSPGLIAEREVYGLTKAWLTFAVHRIALYVAIKSSPIDPQTPTVWRKAKKAYDEALEWADKHVKDLLYRCNFKAMHFVFWGLRLRRIKADYLSSWLGRNWVDAGSLLQFSILYLVLRNLMRRKERNRPERHGFLLRGTSVGADYVTSSAVPPRVSGTQLENREVRRWTLWRKQQRRFVSLALLARNALRDLLNLFPPP